uniref:Uncharacterized protein n=1 Tax=Ditylum brightwellii TaxID=49249 RepID=A0A7S4RIX1_9STRA
MAEVEGIAFLMQPTTDVIAKVEEISYCPLDSSASQDECEAAALTATSGNVVGSLQVVDKKNLPSGCSMRQGDRTVYFNVNTHGEKSDCFTSICQLNPSKMPGVVKVKEVSNCPSGLELDQEECIFAGLTAGGYLLRDVLQVQHRSDVPSGCFVREDDNNLYFNTNPNPNVAPLTQYASICQLSSKMPRNVSVQGWPLVAF